MERHLSTAKGGNIGAYLANFTFAEKADLFTRSAKTVVERLSIGNYNVSRFTNEFWTAMQRQASSIHEVSYRACFKPQLPRFFIKLLSEENDFIYDPFGGRGTTVIEAGLLGRRVVVNDVNPLSRILIEPRFFAPTVKEIVDRLSQIVFYDGLNSDIDLSMFYHSKTESEIMSLRKYFAERSAGGKEDNIDRWVRMVATNRLTGHSPGFFSVYTLPPNQAVTQESQIKINAKRGQKPEYRDVSRIILSKSESLLKNVTEEQRRNLRKAGESAQFLNCDARYTTDIPSGSVRGTVTSPPFLNIVQYSKDNWLRCWFNSIDDKEVSKKITMSKTVEEWSAVMEDVFVELFRVTKTGGFVAFEVGEVKKGSVRLDEHVVPLGVKGGFECVGIIVNLQEFTKTSNIWGVDNNDGGTNTNRIVLFVKR
ncbi:MAG: site-specific DNA-methyltransferase [Deltaproteobacteria bacterium]|nr:site-specific DNA-methyltransferase [Deltaproteobacteria bacterium]